VTEHTGERYRCIVADPPWLERGGGKIRRGADRHYPIMRTHQIIETMLRAPCWSPDDSGCHLWLWVTDGKLPDGLEVMQALGFRYIRTMVWVKDRIGLGQYLRGQHEICLLGVRGRLPALSRSEPSVVTAARRKHSQKPEESYRRIEAVSPGPRLEMFARSTRVGWDSWGNQVADDPQISLGIQAEENNS